MWSLTLPRTKRIVASLDRRFIELSPLRRGVECPALTRSPRRYFVDKNGRRVLIGLTIEETFEFEALDSLPTLDESGNHVARDENGLPTTTREKRWLELYGKHDKAWKQWMVETYADRFAEFNFS
jgi:hypothetical protein